MSQIKYVSLIEEEDGNRLLRPGKADREGTFVSIPDDEDERDDWERHEWERVEFWTLPEPMPKSEFKAWYNEQVDAEEPESPYPEIQNALAAGGGVA